MRGGEAASTEDPAPVAAACLLGEDAQARSFVAGARDAEGESAAEDPASVTNS